MSPPFLFSVPFGSAAIEVPIGPRASGLPTSFELSPLGSQTTNFENYVAALSLAANLFKEAKDRGYTKMNLLDIGGGFPAPYDESVKPFQELAKIVNRELDRLFPKNIQILAEPGRFLVATAGTAISTIIGKAVRWSLCVLVVVAALFGGTVFLLKRKPAPPPAQITRLDAPVSPERPQAEIPAARFTDITKEAGITFVHNNGAYGVKLPGNDGRRRGVF